MEIEVGDAFIVKTPPNGKHLYIIIAAISLESILLVNTTTSNRQINCATDCVINPGEGVPNFITQQSTIAYKHAIDARINTIKQLIKQNEWIYEGRFSEEYILEIQRKGLLNKSLANKYKNILKNILELYIAENYA